MGQALTQVRAKIELISCFSSELKANNHVYICLGELSRRRWRRFWRLLWLTCCRWASLDHLLLEVHCTHSFKGGIGSLEDTIPGTPGADYPIYAVPPETSFTCDGQVDGGYYFFFFFLLFSSFFFFFSFFSFFSRWVLCRS